MESTINETISLSGPETFLKYYDEINCFRTSQQDCINHKDDNPLKCTTYTKVRFEDFMSKSEIPPIGICSEVLFYIAMKKKNIYIEPSSEEEDERGHVDFNLLGYPTDITTTYHTKDYKKKLSHFNSQIVLCPLILPEKRDECLSQRVYPNKTTYAYKLLKTGEFDYNKFIEEVIEINYLVLDLIDTKDNSRKNKYRLKFDQFGNIHESLILQQRLLLECLSDFL